MTSCFIALGKCGDIISTLPILHREFVTTKQKPCVVVSKQYAEVLERAPFINPVVYQGDWMDLSGALKFAKQKFDRVTVLSVFGKDFPMEHRTASFQLEAYERAGKLNLWDQLRLQGLSPVPRVKFEAQSILFADHSQSSPFLQKEDLFALLKESFPKHQILRLSSYKLPHFFDFVSWYDAADAVVCVESAHLHLSAATSRPVAALTMDKPSKWNGSAWSKRFSFYCRYSEYPNRKPELVECLLDAMNRKPKPEVVELN